MRKVAVYVAGMTELVFVYHCITGRHDSDWNAFHLDYVSVNPSDRIGLPNNYGDDAAENHYLLYNCGSDDNVLPTMKDRFPMHLQQGFTGIIGLQDIYGSRYFNVYKGGHRQVERSKVEALMGDLEATVADLDPSGKMNMRFSVMEIESWLLAMPDLLTEIFPDFPHGQFADIDPEMEFVHPFKVLSDIVPYSKSFSTVESIFSRISQSHLDTLLQSGKCVSFSRFYDCLFG